ncbi:MAG: pentapeptide repeat-containing protein [Candidatus Brocadiia bacterium]
METGSVPQRKPRGSKDRYFSLKGGCKYAHPSVAEFVCPFPVVGSREGVPLCYFHLGDDPDTTEKPEPSLVTSALSELLRNRGVIQIPDWHLAGLPLVNLHFEAVEIFRTDFSGADLSWSVFDKARLIFCEFGASKMTMNRMVEAVISHSRFIGADLVASDLSRLSATKCNFAEAKLSSAKLRYASFENCILSGVHGGSADFSAANLTDCDLRDSFFRRARFIDCNLVDVDFSGADLAFADFTGSRFTGVSFVGSNLECVIGLDPPVR